MCGCADTAVSSSVNCGKISVSKPSTYWRRHPGSKLACAFGSWWPYVWIDVTPSPYVTFTFHVLSLCVDILGALTHASPGWNQSYGIRLLFWGKAAHILDMGTWALDFHFKSITVCFSFLLLSWSVCHFPFKFYGWKHGWTVYLTNLSLVFTRVASWRVWCWAGLLWPLCSGASVPGCRVRPLCFHPWRRHQSAGVRVSLACYLGILSFKHCILPKPFYLTTIFPCRKCWLQAPPGFLNCAWFIETDFQGCPHCLWTQVFNKRCPSLFPHLTS